MSFENRNVYKHILDIVWSRIHEPAPILFFYKGHQLLHSLTYAEIWKWSWAWKNWIQKNTSEELVIISLPTGPDFIGALFGTMMAGKIPVPIVSKDLAAQTDYDLYLEKITLKTKSSFVINKSFPHSLDNPAIQQQQIQRCSSETLNPIALIQFSSGSTSEPKGLILRHENILANLKQISTAIPTQPGDKLATWLPLYHDMGLIGAMLAPLYTKTPATYHSPVDFVQNPLQWIEFVSEKKCTGLVGPDFMYQILAKKESQLNRTLDLSDLRVCMSGAEPVKYETCQNFIERFARHGLKPHVMMPVYGMAESSLGVSFSKFNSPLKSIRIDRDAYKNNQIQLTDDSKGLRLVSCGQALVDIEIQIRKDNQVLPENEIGLIYFKSPSQTAGILNSKEQTDLLIDRGWIKTGDLGFIHQGELYICGRQKDLIIVNGKKFHAVDIEKTVQNISTDFGRCAAVIGESSAITNESLVVCIESKKILVQSTLAYEEKVRTTLRSVLGNQVHIEVIFVPAKSLPRTTSGKLQRYKVREMLPQLRREKNFFFLAVRGLHGKIKSILFLSRYLNYQPWKKNNLRSEIKMIFAEIGQLPTSQVDFNKNISDYGIDSVKMIQLLQQLEKRYGPISLATLYSFKNLEDIYQFISLSKR